MSPNPYSSCMLSITRRARSSSFGRPKIKAKSATKYLQSSARVTLIPHYFHLHIYLISPELLIVFDAPTIVEITDLRTVE